MRGRLRRAANDRSDHRVVVPATQIEQRIVVNDRVIGFALAIYRGVSRIAGAGGRRHVQ